MRPHLADLCVYAVGVVDDATLADLYLADFLGLVVDPLSAHEQSAELGAVEPPMTEGQHPRDSATRRVPGPGVRGSVGDVSIDDLVARIAKAADDGALRVAVAESLTCGALVSALGAGDDSAEWLAGGVVAYQPATKVDVLGVDPATDPCSAECAVQLAVGVRELLGADVAVSTTGVGGPGADGGHEPGTVFVGWSSARGHGHRGYRFDGRPDQVLEQTVDVALRELLERLENEG